MQTDIWLTEEITYSERCPLCSQPLKNGSTTCFSCGFSTKSPTGTSVWIDPAVYGLPLSSSQRQSHQASKETGWRFARELPQARRHPNPITPIPPRASAQPSNATPGSIVKPYRSQKNATYGIEKQQRADHRGAPHTAYESSAHVETHNNSPVWEYETPAFQASSSLPTLSLLISEEPTQPELESRGKVTRRLHRIDEITTIPPLNVDHSITSSRALVPVNSHHDVTSEEVDAPSWTAGKASRSSHARLISSRSKRKNPYMAVSLNPFDRLRWWLLRPGHIEFVLWLVGTILLVAVTCILLLVTAFSFEWITPRFINPALTNASGTSTEPEQQATVIATPEMVLIRTDTGPVLPGQLIGLHGQGFSPHGHITFLFDGTEQLFDQNGNSDSTQANAQGVFSTTVVLNSNLPWHPGTHFINARDITTKRMAKLTIILAPNPIGKGVPSTPVPSYPPIVTPPGPSPVPTVGTTPTPSVTTTAGTTVGSGLGNALDHTEDSYLGKQLTHPSPWVWLMIDCYCLSMVVLGLAASLAMLRFLKR